MSRIPVTAPERDEEQITSSLLRLIRYESATDKCRTEIIRAQERKPKKNERFHQNFHREEKDLSPPNLARSREPKRSRAPNLFDLSRRFSSLFFSLMVIYIRIVFSFGWWYFAQTKLVTLYRHLGEGGSIASFAVSLFFSFIQR
ncbi:hypothetical protein VNO77_27890 [Canavalia gladiata]|uniref:Uncharacterized protein n=1 Tax=Canavalia gladiata TaxID=3824 RepID=A0AAN9KVH5_CANGL